MYCHLSKETNIVNKKWILGDKFPKEAKISPNNLKIPYFSNWPFLTLVFRIGLTLHRNKMARCAGTCGGEEGQCQAERFRIQFIIVS